MQFGEPSYEYRHQFINKRETLSGRNPADPTAQTLIETPQYHLPIHARNPVRHREFIGWDGEGITYPGEVAQSYVLFGASTGDRISKPKLGSLDCFNTLLGVESTYPDAIHAGFALHYDVNMMLRDLSRRHLEMLYRHNKVWWEGIRIEYRPGKWLNLRHKGVTVRLFDVWGFFQSSFVVACERFLGADDPELVRIREGKRRRSSFTYDELEPFIVPYWEGELRLLVRLLDSLRDDLNNAGLGIHSWHGPGAVANTVFRIHGIHKAKAETPPAVNRAAQYAYAGGRFELFQCGTHHGPVWEYDLNSAYPTAIAQLPNLSRGNWRYSDSFQPGSFGVWHIRYKAASQVRGMWFTPQPLFFRDEHGNVSYPSYVEGWYWTPEAELVDQSFIDGGWVFEPNDPDEKPFAFVEEYYNRRQEWKSQGNSAEKALKLALNSLYGKMAQRTGWKYEGDPIPRWHQLEWAGYVTSTTRASLFTAISQQPTDVIAVETDAIFTTCSLTLEGGKDLGQWEATKFDWITYLQSGMYYAGQGDTVIEKYRGFDRESLPWKKVNHTLQRQQWFDNPEPLTGMTTRFIGLGLGLHTKARWRSWQQEPRNVIIGGGGKRRHFPGMCPSCKRQFNFADALHPLIIATPGGRSQPHRLPWLADQEPELRRQDELEKW